MLSAFGGSHKLRVCGALPFRGGPQGSETTQSSPIYPIGLQRAPAAKSKPSNRLNSLCSTKIASVKHSSNQNTSDANQMSQSVPKAVVAVTLLAAAGAACYVFGIQQLSVKDVAASLDKIVRSYGPYGPVIFILAYVAATLFLIPSTALTLAAGYLSGPGFGIVWVSLAATLGATLAFLVSRYLARPYAKAKLQSYPKLASIEEQIPAEGVKLVFLLRLAPLVPFTVLNYALGVTDVSLASYVAATWLGKLPGLFSQVYLGSTGRSIDAATSSKGLDKVSLTLNVVGVVASILVTKLLADKASAVLKDDTDIDS